MDASDNNKSFELDRSASRAGSTRLSHALAEDNDDYGLQALVADGFRPAEVARNHTGPHVARSSISSLDHPAPRAVSPRPSSISKPQPAYESFLAHEGFGQASARSSGVPADSLAMTVETPYEGPSGPSHPYQMYPQDVLRARATSSATTSTGSVSRQSYNGPRHPTHPYGIYSQNVTFGDDESGDRPQRGVSVRFPGTSDPYQRRIGPDGEEVADMIGPDGHTEQLPPYTRYPQEVYGRKASGIDTAQPTLMSPPAQPHLEIPGAGGIGLATRNPEFASTEDLNQLNSPQSRLSIRSFKSEVSHHSINTAALVATNEKSTGNWKEAARRKVWGFVPCWAVVLGVIVLVLLGVVVGTVIGTVIAPQLNKNHDNKPSDSEPAPPPGPVPLPQGLPSLPEGNYSLPLSLPHYTDRCVQNLSQKKAWNCDAIVSELVMSVSRQQDVTDTTTYELYFTYNHTYTEDSFVYSYGVQPPSIASQQLQLVDDTFEPSLGPAWAFIVPYNKTVILPETYLTPSNDTSESLQKRIDHSGLQRKGVAQKGDRPWICTWPDTILEIFIFLGQNGSTQSHSTTSSRAAALPGAKLAGGHRRDVMERQYGHTGHLGDDLDYSPYLPSPTTPLPTTPTLSSTPTFSNELVYFSPPPVPPSPYSPYPKVVKLKERRDPSFEAPPPRCRQMEIVATGVEAVPRLDGSGHHIEIQIAEVPPEKESKHPGSSPLKRSSHLPPALTGRDDQSDDDDLDDCGCIWWLN
ncbi:hypothetical protein F4861DRAFT_550863 [Xylaria intraflava]|nr:hypothetical protein F4861DRAFT_550863 [Xylaria intraflava]